MDAGQGQRGRIDRIMVGDPIEAGGHTLEPVALAGGWYGGGDGEQGRGFGALVRIQPVEVRVRDPNGVEHTVSITDPSREATRQLVLSALFVAAVSMLVILVGRVLARRTRG
jgi:uncharacterized spore protein YtfJ